VLRDADGIAQSNQVWFAESAGGLFDRLVRTEGDFRWQDGVQDARVHTFLEGQLHDDFRTVRDVEGRLLMDGQREWPGLNLRTRLEYEGATERLRRTEEFQNDRLRRVGIPLAEERSADGSVRLPVRFTPHWGLVTTQWLVLGESLGRARETVTEEGQRSRTLEWFPGTTVARRTETQDRSGQVRERSTWTPAVGSVRGIPVDQLTRSWVSDWAEDQGREVRLEYTALARGSDVAVSTDTAEGRIFFNLGEPWPVPEFTVDGAGRSGVSVRLGARLETQVKSVARGRIRSTTPDHEARLELQVVSLQSLFEPVRTMQILDRAGKVLEARVSRLPNPGAAGFTAEALLDAVPIPGDQFLQRQEYSPGWLVRPTVGSVPGPVRVFTTQAPAEGASAIQVNVPPHRDLATAVETFLVGSGSAVRPEGELRPVSRADEVRQLRSNPYLPDEFSGWTAWTTHELTATGQEIFQTEELYDVRGQRSVRRSVKQTFQGEIAIKLAYQLPSPTSAEWVSLGLTNGVGSVTLQDNRSGVRPETAFLYLFVRSPQPAVPTLRFTDRRGRQVRVGGTSNGSVPGSLAFWPMSAAFTLWLPNEVDPTQAATVAEPVGLPAGVNAYVVNVAELAHAGLELPWLSRVDVESSAPLAVTSLKSLNREEPLVRSTEPQTQLRVAEKSPHEFQRISQMSRSRSPAARYAGEEVQTVVERNGRPLVVTRPAARRSPFPDLIVLATRASGEPLPLYQLSSADGHFQQHFQVVPQADSVQVYSIVQGFELPRFEVHRSQVLGDELSPAFVAYGYDYHARVALAKGVGAWGRTLAVLRNRVAANPFSYAGERVLDRLKGSSGLMVSRFNYGSLHNARVQAAAIHRLPTLAEALLPTRTVPCDFTNAVGLASVELDLAKVAAALRELHVSRFGTNLTRSMAGTYLIPTAPDTVAERYVTTVAEAAIISLAIKVGEAGVARALLEFYWEKSDGGLEPVQESYDASSGMARTRELAFTRPVQARPTASARLALASAALDLADLTGETRWETFADNLVTGVLTRFRPPAQGSAVRGISEPEYRVVERALGLVFWPEAARFPVDLNADGFALLERITQRRRLLPAEADGKVVTQAALEEQRSWLSQVVLPEVIRTGVVPVGWFEVQDIYGETSALAPERWTSPSSWLAWLQIAGRFGVETGTARGWLENLARVHGVTVDGLWGIDWSLPLLRSEAISPELTARFARVASRLGHHAAAARAGDSLARLGDLGKFPAAYTAVAPVRPLKSEQGLVVFPRQDGSGWPRAFSVEWELVATNAPTADSGGLTRLRPDRDASARPSRADLAVFATLAGLFYIGVLLVTLVWWRFRRLRRRLPEDASNPLLVPEAVMSRAEERWAARVLGVQSPDGAAYTRFSNAPVEQNFLMQLRAIYKLVLEWRRRENRWSEEDPRLIEDASDPWLNGLDEFASVLGLYLRYVIKAGAKDGFDQEHPFAGQEDSNHLWSRLVMYLSEHYWTLLTLMRTYQALPTDQECALFEWEFAKALETLGVRRRPEPFDARQLFNYPANPDALDLLVIQKPGITLEQVMQFATVKLQTALTHLMRIVEGYRAWKRRESPFPIHPYLIELAKIFPNFVLTGLGALIWYNQSVGDSPIFPYLWPQAVAFVLNPKSLAWALPLCVGLVLGGVAGLVRTYRFEGGLLKRERPSLILDATMTSFFRRSASPGQGIPAGWQWNPAVYQRASWICRIVGWSILAAALFQLETPSFANFLIVKGVIALWVVTEVAGLVIPLAVTWVSLAIQDYVGSHPHCGSTIKFLNRLNLTATRPASPLWLSVRYYLRPSVPTGDWVSRVQSIGFYLVLNFGFLFVGVYLCQQILPLWITETYLNASSWKLLVGGLVFWNTLYLLRYGLFLLATAVAAGLATFPLRSLAAMAGLAGVARELFRSGAATESAPPSPWMWLGAAVLVVLVVAEESIRSAWTRWRPRHGQPSGDIDVTGATGVGNRTDTSLGIVYMSGDDLSFHKLTPTLLLTRWRVLRDQLGSSGLRLLHRMAGELPEPELERLFAQLYALEQSQAVTLWYPGQLVVAGENPVLDPALGLNLAVDSAEQRQELLSAWDARRWLVTMMSTAGHAQDTAINLVDIALRLDRESLAPRTVFYLVQNKYDNQDGNRPVQLQYTEGELGHRDKLARLLRALAPGCRAWSVQNWTPFGFKSAGMTGMDLIPEETMALGTMVVLDRNATVHDLDAFSLDLRTALADPDLVIIIPGRGTTNTLTDLGQGSQLIEEGHRSFLRGVMTFLGGRASEGVGTGWGNIVTVTYGRVQRAMMRPLTPKMPLTSRMQRGSTFAVQTEGLIGFTPHAVGISEDTWAVSQAAHNVAALGGRVRFALSSAMWHMVRETWSHAEWLAAFPRWSGGYLQMMQDPLMQRINEFGPASIFAKELRSNSGRNFLAAPFALLNALLLPLAIILDVTPFIQILMLLWNFGFVMNQVLTLHGLNAYLEGAGFHRWPALLGAVLGGVGSVAWPELRPLAPALTVLGALYGGFVVGLNRWLVTRVRDVILFGPQLVLHALGQLMRQSIEFMASGAAASDAQGVNMAFRAGAGPREDRPLEPFPHFINLRTVVWVIGLPSLLLNLLALANLDMFNVLLLLPSLLFSVSLVAGPFLTGPRPGRFLGAGVLLPKGLGWLTALVFFVVVSLLVARGGWQQTLGFGLFLVVVGRLTWVGGRYLFFRWRWRGRERQLRRQLVDGGVEVESVDRVQREVVAAGDHTGKLAAVLTTAGLGANARASLEQWVQARMRPLVQEPSRARLRPERARSEFQRAFVLALLVLLWFFVVPVPGLFVFTAGAYKTSMSLGTIMTGLSVAIGLALVGFGLGRLVQTWERTRRGSAGLEPRVRAAFAVFQRRLGDPGGLSAEESSRLFALFTDLKTYFDQRSDAYVRRTLDQVEQALNRPA